jgi:uncharacterized membrane protein
MYVFDLYSSFVNEVEYKLVYESDMLGNIGIYRMRTCEIFSIVLIISYIIIVILHLLKFRENLKIKIGLIVIDLCCCLYLIYKALIESTNL